MSTRFAALLPLALVVSVTVGSCSGGGKEDGARPGDGTGGERHTLQVHCGVLSTHHQGQLWLADPPLGDHGPPEGWDENRVEGEFIRTGEESAEFRGDNGERASFRRAADGADDPNEGCE